MAPNRAQKPGASEIYLGRANGSCRENHRRRYRRSSILQIVDVHHHDDDDDEEEEEEEEATYTYSITVLQYVS